MNKNGVSYANNSSMRMQCPFPSAFPASKCHNESVSLIESISSRLTHHQRHAFKRYQIEFRMYPRSSTHH